MKEMKNAESVAEDEFMVMLLEELLD